MTMPTKTMPNKTMPTKTVSDKARKQFQAMLDVGTILRFKSRGMATVEQLMSGYNLKRPAAEDLHSLITKELSKKKYVGKVYTP